MDPLTPVAVMCMVLLDVSGSVDPGSYAAWSDGVRTFAESHCEGGVVRVLEIGSGRAVQDACTAEIPAPPSRRGLRKLKEVDPAPRARALDALGACVAGIRHGGPETTTPLATMLRLAADELRGARGRRRLLVLSDFLAPSERPENLEGVDVSLGFAAVASPYLHGRNAAEVYLETKTRWCGWFRDSHASDVEVSRSASMRVWTACGGGEPIRQTSRVP